MKKKRPDHSTVNRVSWFAYWVDFNFRLHEKFCPGLQERMSRVVVLRFSSV